MQSPREYLVGFLALSVLMAGLFIPSGTAFVMEEDVEPIFKVLLTEVLANPIGVDDHEWIEIGNLGTVPVHLGTLTLQSGTKKFIPTAQELFPGEYRRFPKSETKLTLANNGGSISLLSGSVLLDAYTYPETAEEVSYGRERVTEQLRAFCVPTPGRANELLELHPHIDIQSGEKEAVGKVSLNLGVSVSSGSLVSASCSWAYSDGYTSSSCNPPSHTFSDPGPITVTVTVSTMCGEEIVRTLTGAVIADEVEQDIPPTILSESPLEHVEETCVPQFYTGAIIKEFLPNPKGEDSLGEWITLENATNEDLDLCGWILDDEASGSSVFPLDGFYLPARGSFSFKRSVTGIALNNDADSVRLFIPGISVENPVPYQEVQYSGAGEGEKYARTSESTYEWTLLSGEKEHIRILQEPHVDVIVSAALPLPLFQEDEWIEVTNVGSITQDLSGWVLDNHVGGSDPYTMSGVVLQPAETRRFFSTETKIFLTDSADMVQLLRPDGIVHSAFAWEKAVPERIERVPLLASHRVPVRIEKVLDAETLGIMVPNPDDLRFLPDSVRRYWLASGFFGSPMLRVHPQGVSLKHGAYEFMQEVAEGKTAFLEFEPDPWQTKHSINAYITLDSGTSLERLLLQNGYAEVRDENFARKTEYVLLQTPTSMKEIVEVSSKNIVQSFVQGVVISEIYPSPNSGEQEWVELYNPTAVSLSLAGWSLDDEEKGSKPWKFPAETVFAPGEYLVFTKEQTKLSLNNDGDEVRLFLPDGVVAHSLTYGTVKKGLSVVLTSDGACVTSSLTKGTENVCSEIVAAKPKIAPVKKASSIKVKYENVVTDETILEPIMLSPLFQNLKNLEKVDSVKRVSWEFDFISCILGMVFSCILWLAIPHIRRRILEYVRIMRIADLA